MDNTKKFKAPADANIFQKLIYLIKYIFTYWNRPPKGAFLNYKEFGAYCVGGMGVVGATLIPQFVTLTAGMYIAAALNIAVKDIVYVGIVTSIITVLRTPLISWIIDNTNSKIGKFRPWLLWLPIPIILSMVAIVFIPHALISNYTAMLVVFTILFNILNFMMTLYSGAYTTLVLVISPSHQERTNLMSIGSVIYSLGPSIVNFAFPLFANLLFTTKDANGEVVISGINDIRSMQMIVPIMAAVFLAIGLMTAFGTKERVMQKKATVNKVGFVDGIKSVSKNKYFWINNLSIVIGVFRMVAASYVVWIATYYIKTAWAQSILVTIAGSACVPGMVLAPILIKKFGKKKLTIFINIMCAVLTVPVVLAAINPIPATPYIMYAMILLITVINGASIVILPSFNAMINDYQQYKTGERIEGFMAQLGAMILTGVGIGTAFILPAVYQKFGFTSDVKVLNNTKEVTSPIILWTSLIGVLSGLLSAIPFFFWDLSEKRHGRIMEILAVRAQVGNGKISSEEGAELEAKIEAGESGIADEIMAEVAEENIEELSESMSIKDFIKQEHERQINRKNAMKDLTKEEKKAFLAEEKVARQKRIKEHKQESILAKQRDKQLEQENWEMTKENKRQEAMEKARIKKELQKQRKDKIAEEQKMLDSLSKEELAAYKAKKKEARKIAKAKKKEETRANWKNMIEQEKRFKAIEKENFLRDNEEEKRARVEKKLAKKEKSNK